MNDDESESDQPAPAAEGVPSGLEDFYTQELSWNNCGTGILVGEAPVHQR